MAIPWLIGAAVLGTVAYISSSDDGNDEYEERRRIRRRAEREKERAKEEEKLRQVKQKKQQLKGFVKNKLVALTIEHDVKIDTDALVVMAIDDPFHCNKELNSAFQNSKTQRNLNKNISDVELEIQKMEELYKQLQEL